MDSCNQDPWTAVTSTLLPYDGCNHHHYIRVPRHPHISGCQNSGVATISKKASELEIILKDFVNSTGKYNEALGRKSRWSDGIPRKLQWHIVEASKVKELRDKISLQLSIIKMLHQLSISDSLANYQASREVNHNILLVNSTEQLSVCNEIHRLQLSSNLLLRDRNTIATLSASTIIAKLDAQNTLSRKIISIPAGEDDSSTMEKIDGTGRDLDLDEDFTAMTSPKGKQIKISLKDLGCVVTQELLEARNIADALTDLLNEIKSILREITTLEHKRGQDRSLGAVSKELMNQASLLGQQLFKRTSAITWGLTRTVYRKAGALLAINYYNAMKSLTPWPTGLFANLRSLIPRPLSSTPSLVDSIHFLDAAGTSRFLPFAYFRHYRTFITMLEESYRDTPTGRYIRRRRFCLVGTGLIDGKVITQETWGHIIYPGIRIAMSIVLSQVTASKTECPKCKSPRTQIENGCLHSCISCGLRVYPYSGERRLGRGVCQDGTGILPLGRRSKQRKTYRFSQDLAGIGFSPDRVDEDRWIEETDIQYFKRLTMHTKNENNECGQHISNVPSGVANTDCKWTDCNTKDLRMLSRGQ